MKMLSQKQGGIMVQSIYMCDPWGAHRCDGCYAVGGYGEQATLIDIRLPIPLSGNTLPAATAHTSGIVPPINTGLYHDHGHLATQLSRVDQGS